MSDLDCPMCAGSGHVDDAKANLSNWRIRAASDKVEITRLRDLCSAYRGQVEEGERWIRRLEAALVDSRARETALRSACDSYAKEAQKFHDEARATEGRRDTATLALSDLRAALIHARYVIYGLMTEDQPGVSEEELHRQYPLQFDPINTALSQALTADKEGE